MLFFKTQNQVSTFQRSSFIYIYLKKIYKKLLNTIQADVEMRKVVITLKNSTARRCKWLNRLLKHDSIKYKIQEEFIKLTIKKIQRESKYSQIYNMLAKHFEDSYH